MTAAPPGPNLFSSLADEHVSLARTRETFAASFIGQAAILVVIIYFTSFVITDRENHLAFPTCRIPSSFTERAAAEAPVIRYPRRLEMFRPHGPRRQSCPLQSWFRKRFLSCQCRSQ